MNIAILIGNVVADPDVKRYDSSTVCRMRLAVDKDYSEGADYLPVTCFGKTAEICEQYVREGKKILVKGRNTSGSYEKDGKKIYTYEIIADNITFL